MYKTIFFNKNLFWIFIFFACIVRLVISLELTTKIITFGRHDEALYINTAINLINGNWLGSYNALTLAKGPVFSLFLAFVYFVHLPYLFVISFFHCLCVCYLIYSSYQFFGSKFSCAFLGLILLFDPTGVSGRVLRNELYISLGCVLLGVLLGMFSYRELSNKYFEIIECLFVFLCFGMLWYTREEVLILNLLTLFSLILAIFYRLITKNKILLRYLMCGICGVVCFFLVFCSFNYKYYDRFITIESINSPFTSAYGTLIALSDKSGASKSMLSPDKIRTVARYSKTMDSISQCLIDSDITRGWAKFSPVFHSENLEWANDLNKNYVTGDWSQWQFRDCMEKEGYYKDALTSSLFFLNIKKEIDNAIQSGHLHKIPFRFVSGPFYIDVNNFCLLLPVFKLGIERMLFTEKRVESFSANESLGNVGEIVLFSKMFGFRAWNKDITSKQSLLSKASYVVWNKILKYYNFYIKIIQKILLLASIFLFAYLLLKKQYLYIFVLSICFSLVFLRFFILSAIFVCAFDCFVPDYFSIGYVPIAFISIFTLDQIFVQLGIKWCPTES